MKKILSATLAFVLFIGAAQAQEVKDSARHHRDHGNMMKQLNLSADQQTRFKALHKSEKTEMQALKSNQSLTEDQKKAQRKELHKKYQDQMQSVLTPAQKEQFEKMKTAHHGNKHGKKGGKHNSAATFKQLNLTHEQNDQLVKLKEQSKGQFESIRKDQALTDAQKKAKAQELRKQNRDQMKSILTADQIQKMQELRKERKSKDAK